VSHTAQLRHALAKCQHAAANVPAFVRPHLVPVADFCAIVVQEIEQLKARNAMLDELLAGTPPVQQGEEG
jgi:hypothetical protein